MKRLSLILVFLVFLFGKINAQATSTVQIMDLLVIENITPNVPPDTLNLSFKVNFKIFPASSGNKVLMLFGTQKDSGNVQDTYATFIHQTGSDQLTFNGQTSVITRYTASIPMQMVRAQLPTTTYVTVFVEDINGNFTNRLYYSFSR